jgi:hypothetical protein
MATQVLPRRRTAARRKKKNSLGWLMWWPLVVAIAATPFAVKTAEVLPLMGAEGLLRLRLLYPFALLAQQHLGLNEALGESVSQALLYLQFPLYAVLLIVVHRIKSFMTAVFVVVTIHLIAAASVWILSI